MYATIKILIPDRHCTFLLKVIVDSLPLRKAREGNQEKKCTSRWLVGRNVSQLGFALSSDNQLPFYVAGALFHESKN